MKNFHAAVAAAAFVACVQPAVAGDNALDVSELTCEQFTNYNDDNKGLVMMWFEGYYTDEDEDAVIDFGKMAGHLAKLLIAARPIRARRCWIWPTTNWRTSQRRLAFSRRGMI